MLRTSSTSKGAVVADAERLPFGSSSFDFVAERSILSYVDKETVLGQIRAVLRPDGLLVIAEKVLGDYEGAAEDWYQRVQQVRNPLKRRATTTSALAADLKSCGFDVVSSVELRRTYKQSLDAWLSRSGSIGPADQERLLELLHYAPPFVRELGLDVSDSGIRTPISWAVVCSRPAEPRPNPSLVVTVLPVRWRDGELLVYMQERRAALHKEPDYFGVLEFPQGHVDSQERIEEAARRELAEEAGLAVKRFINLWGAPEVATNGPVTVESLHPAQVVVTRGRLNFISLMLVAEVVADASETGAVDNRGKWYSRERFLEVVATADVYPLNRPMVERASGILGALTPP